MVKMNLFNNWQLLMGIFVVVGAMGMFYILWQFFRWSILFSTPQPLFPYHVSTETVWFAMIIAGVSTLFLVIGIKGL